MEVALRTRSRDHDDGDQPPEPADILARFGVLLAISLGFALVAQLLLRAPH